MTAAPERRVVSDGEHFCGHSYFDISPESPDGRRVVYSRFTSGPPPCGVRHVEDPAGSGEVVVCNLDGADARPVGEFGRAYGHTMAYALWIDHGRVAHQDLDEVVVTDVDSGRARRSPGACHMHHPEAGGIFTHIRFQTNAPDLMPGFEAAAYTFDPDTAACRRVVTLAELFAATPAGRLVVDDGRWFLNHAKWSPGGTRAACKAMRPKGEGGSFVFTFRPDGSDIRWFRRTDGVRYGAALHWSFYDEDSLYGYDSFHPEAPLPCRRFTLDGEVIETLHEGNGNHASLSPDRRWIVTDGMYGTDPIHIYLYRAGSTRGRVVATMRDERAHTHAHPVFGGGGRAYFNATDAGAGGQLCCVDLKDLLRGEGT